jgi:hypothetical protein
LISELRPTRFDCLVDLMTITRPGLLDAGQQVCSKVRTLAQ